MKSYDPKGQETRQYRFGNGGDDNELCLDGHSGESGVRCLLNKRIVNNLALHRLAGRFALSQYSGQTAKIISCSWKNGCVRT